jgi:Ca2+-transporting ATPase
MAFIFAVHVPIAGFALMPLLLGLPILFGPIHIALLEIVIDPVCAFVFEAEDEEPNIMTRPPRAPDEPLFSWTMIAWSIFQGATAFAILAGIYAFALRQGFAESHVRTLVFFTLVAAILSLIFVNRSYAASVIWALGRKNKELLYVLLSLLVMSWLMLSVPMITTSLKFSSLNASDFFMALAGSAVLLLFLQAMKLIVFRQPPRKTIDP